MESLSFCNDFDDAATAFSTDVWTSTDVGAASGTITLVEAGAVSAPNAARISLVDGGTNCGILNLSRTFSSVNGTELSAITTRVSVRPETEGNFLTVVAAPTKLPGRTYRVIVGIDRPTGLTATIYAALQPFDNTVDGGFGQVVSQSMKLDADPFGRTLDVSVEIIAKPTPSIILREAGRALVVTAPTDLQVKTPRIDVGPYCRKSATFTYDDVAVWLTP